MYCLAHGLWLNGGRRTLRVKVIKSLRRRNSRSLSDAIVRTADKMDVGTVYPVSYNQLEPIYNDLNSYEDLKAYYDSVVASDREGA